MRLDLHFLFNDLIVLMTGLLVEMTLRQTMLRWVQWVKSNCHVLFHNILVNKIN